MSEGHGCLPESHSLQRDYLDGKFVEPRPEIREGLVDRPRQREEGWEAREGEAIFA